MPYAEFHCVHLLYSSVQFEKIFGEAGTKGVGSRGVYAILYAMYSTKDTIWLRQDQGYLSAHASTDRKAGRFSLLFYSIEFFGLLRDRHRHSANLKKENQSSTHNAKFLQHAPLKVTG